MNQNIYLLIGLVVLISLSECFGQSSLKRYYNDPTKTYFYFIGVLFYAVVCLLLVMSYKFSGMGLVNILWSGISVLTILTTGILFFDETVTRMDWAGVVLILAGISFIVWEGEH